MERSATQLSHNGISIEVPAGWDGRTLYLDQSGSKAVLQMANFELPSHAEFSPPSELPSRIDDRIEAMSGSDLIITLAPQDSGMPVSGSLTMSRHDLAPASVPHKPVGRALIEQALCFGAKCLQVSIIFGANPPDDSAYAQINAILATLAVR